MIMKASDLQTWWIKGGQTLFICSPGEALGKGTHQQRHSQISHEPTEPPFSRFISFLKWERIFYHWVIVKISKITWKAPSMVLVAGLLTQSLQLCPTLQPYAVAHQAPLSMRFSRQEYWSGLPYSPPGDLPDPVIKPTSVYIFCIGRQVLYH